MRDVRCAMRDTADFSAVCIAHSAFKS